MLRPFVLLAAGAQTAYWLFTLVFGLIRSNPHGDGLEWMPAFFATPAFLAVTVPALALAAAGRYLPVAAVLAGVGVVAVPFAFWTFVAPDLFAFLLPLA